MLQGLDGLELYYQVDAARDEAGTPPGRQSRQRGRGLRCEAKMLLDAGKSAEAGDPDFRRPYRLDTKSDVAWPHPRIAPRCPAGRVARRFRHASFAGRRGRAAPGRRGATGDLFPLHGHGPSACRRLAAGRRVYLELVDLEEAKPALEIVDRSHLLPAVTVGSGPAWVCFASEGGTVAAAQIDRGLKRTWRRPRRTRSLTACGRSSPSSAINLGDGGAGRTVAAAAQRQAGADHGGRIAHGRGRRSPGGGTARPRPACWPRWPSSIFILTAGGGGGERRRRLLPAASAGV